MVSTRRHNLIPFRIAFPPFARGMKKVNEKMTKKADWKKRNGRGVFCVMISDGHDPARS